MNYVTTIFLLVLSLDAYMDLNFVEEVQLIVEYIVCAVFAAVETVAQGFKGKNVAQKYTGKQFVVQVTNCIIISVP